MKELDKNVPCIFEVVNTPGGLNFDSALAKNALEEVSNSQNNRYLETESVVSQIRSIMKSHFELGQEMNDSIEHIIEKFYNNTGESSENFVKISEEVRAAAEAIEKNMQKTKAELEVQLQ